jgi:hypothetical protein
MNNQKLNHLFRAARKEAPPSAEPGFAKLVLAAIRQESIGRETEAASLFDQLGGLFPRWPARRWCSLRFAWRQILGWRVRRRRI